LINSSIPCELFCYVAQYFNISDVGNAASVCRLWKERFDNQDVWKEMARGLGKITPEKAIKEKDWKKYCQVKARPFDHFFMHYSQLDEMRQMFTGAPDNLSSIPESLFTSVVFENMMQVIEKDKAYYGFKGFGLNGIKHMCGRKRYRDAHVTNLPRDVTDTNFFYAIDRFPLTKGLDASKRRYIAIRYFQYKMGILLTYVIVICQAKAGKRRWVIWGDIGENQVEGAPFFERGHLQNIGLYRSLKGLLETGKMTIQGTEYQLEGEQ